MRWEPNPNFASLPTTGPGDIIHLKLVSTFEYLVKALVANTSKESISAIVEAIFDWHSHDQVAAAEVNQLVGETLLFEPKFLHNVIKKPQG